MTKLKLYNSQDPIIIKSNALVDAEYSLGLNQQRLMYSCFAQIAPKEPMRDSYHVYASDFAKTFNIDPKNAYSELKKAADGLYENEIIIFNGELNKKIRLRWVYKAIYLDGEGAVEISFTPDIMPYISQLDRDYVMVRLYMAKSFKKAYSFRLYEIACRYVFRGEKYFDVDEFRTITKLSDKYPRWYDVEKNVLEPSCKEVTKYTDRNLSFESHKRGRTVVGITLFSSEKSKNVQSSSENKKNPNIPPYQEFGYRGMAEYVEAMELGKKHNIEFANATEFYIFKTELNNRATGNKDLFV